MFLHASLFLTQHCVPQNDFTTLKPGKLILQREATPEKPLDITMLQPGIYLYTIYHDNKISSGKVTVF